MDDVVASARGLPSARHEDSRGRAVAVALSEVLLVILPFVLARVIGQFVDFIYVGPIAIVICVIVATALLRARGRRWSDVGLARPASWPKTFLFALATFVAIVLASLLLRGVAIVFGLGAPDISALFVVRESWVMLVIFLFPLSWGTAAFGEEMLMRGFMLHRLAEALGSTRAAWIVSVVTQALIFGLAHSWLGAVGVLQVAVFGIVLGSACAMVRGNLWVGILAHGTVDFVTILAVANP